MTNVILKFMILSIIIISSLYEVCNILTKNCGMEGLYHPLLCVHHITQLHEPRQGRRNNQGIDRLTIIKLLK